MSIVVGAKGLAESRRSSDVRSLFLERRANLNSRSHLDCDFFLKKLVARPFKINGVFAWLDVGDSRGGQPFRLRLARSAFIVRDKQHASSRRDRADFDNSSGALIRLLSRLGL